MTESDYERQFREDLEKAQALSLESLALEKFRMKKLKETLPPALTNDEGKCSLVCGNEKPFCDFKAVSSNNAISRSRPKVESINASTCIPKIKPPPRTTRRTSVKSISDSNETKDLVSFDEPPATYCFEEEEILTGTSAQMSTVASANISNSNILAHQPFKEFSATTFPLHNATELNQMQIALKRSSLQQDIPFQRTEEVDLSVLEVVKKRDDQNLIDLTLFNDFSSNSQSNPFFSNLVNNIQSNHKRNNSSHIRYSILEAFDPLHQESKNRLSTFQEVESNSTLDTAEPVDDTYSECSNANSLYAVFDPFDYMYARSECSQMSDPIYAAVINTPINSPPPPLPPRNASSNIYKPKATPNRQFGDNIGIRRRSTTLQDPDLIAFHSMVKRVRGEFAYDDPVTNSGIVISPRIENANPHDFSVKIVVHTPFHVRSIINFTCDVSSMVEHIVLHVTCELECGSADEYLLKVRHFSEYLLNDTPLRSYEYVLNCIKLDQDIEFTLVSLSSLNRSLARTAEDDVCDAGLKLESLLPEDFSQLITFDSLNIVLDTLEKEFKKIISTVDEVTSSNDCKSSLPIKTRGVLQALKAICSLLGNVEPLEVTKSLQVFIEACEDVFQTNFSSKNLGNGWSKPTIIEEDGDYAVIRLDKRDGLEREIISYHVEKIRDSVRQFIGVYCRTFNVDFELVNPIMEFSGLKYSSEMADPILAHIDGLHRLSNMWNCQEYLIAAQIYHGTRPVGHPVLSRISSPCVSFYNRVVFDCWLSFDDIHICLLPRESRLVLVIYGRDINADVEATEDNAISQVELGWTSLQLFDYAGSLSQGSYMLLVWPPCADKRLGPAPPAGVHSYSHSQPILSINMPCYTHDVRFPKIEANAGKIFEQRFDIGSLDQNTRDQLAQIIEQDTYSRPFAEDREVLWEKRHYLFSIPEALPKVFLAAHSWDFACLSDLHSLLRSWHPLKPVDSMQLLLPCFPDVEVRKMAVKWMQPLTDDEVVDFLPQLVQALKHETYETSALAEFLLRRCLSSHRVAHYLYWLLAQQLHSTPFSHDNFNVDENTVARARYFRRLRLTLKVLVSVSGHALKSRFMSQQFLMESLFDISENIKSTKDSLRLNTLLQDLESVCDYLSDHSTCLPVKPSLEVDGVQVKTCSYFPSNTLPLKINFRSVDGGIVAAIFKAGDDLQQDMLTIQMIRIMEQFWLREGLDLKMVTFACISTGDKRGIIEMVTEAETLRKIQIELGLTGSFKDRPIAEWLAKHNPSALEYDQAVRNFTASCAGYSVATYLLGICDRHNDNIMLKKSGHLFHIDFGKFLGDAQTFGNFKRDRSPFVLTPDMAFVINGGDKPTVRFHNFVDLCCQAFNVVRKHGNLLLNLLGMMTSSGIPGVTIDAVHYVQRALLPELSNAEAAATFARMIESSLKSWFTQVNFFLHNLAQLRFNGDHNDGELLSFVPRIYTMNEDDRILDAEVYSVQKRYDPEKYYVYIIKVIRENQPDPSYLFRTYKEFCEFHQKLCMLFPLAKCHSLHSSGPLVGRSNVKQVASKRRIEIEKFLKQLLHMADEISHSDLVYTFFHPLLRDQQEASIHRPKLKGGKMKALQSSSQCVNGELKLSIHYNRGALIVMVHHAKDLPLVSANQEPSTYVKVYLLPDSAKVTKRKTKVIKRNRNPSFMEMLEYRMPREVVDYRVVQATIWHHDTLQENEFLGGVTIPLEGVNITDELTAWYRLGNVYR